MEDGTNREARRFDEVMAGVVDDLQFIHGALDRALDEVRNNNPVELGIADKVESLWNPARAAVELGRALVGRIHETADEMRAYEELPFDEEAAYEAVKGFLASNISTPFTLEDLRDYLDEAGVTYPKNKTDFNRLFKAWQGDAVIDLATDEHKLVWANIDTPRGRPRQYALATIMRAKRTKSEVSEAQSSPPEVEEVERSASLGAEIEPTEVEDGQQVLSVEAQLALNIYKASSDIRAKGLYARLMSVVEGLEEDRAAAVFGELVSAGVLYKRRQGGSLYFTIDPPAPRHGREQSEGQDGHSFELDVDQKELAKAVLDVLAWSQHPGRLKEPRVIVEALKERSKYRGKNITNDMVKAVCRALHRQGMVTVVQAKVKRTTMLKVVLDREIYAAYRQDSAPFLRAIDAGEQFTLDD